MRWPRLLLPLLLLATPATGLPLHATFSGRASGTLGAASFTNAAIVIELVADTDDIGLPPIPIPGGGLIVDVLQAVVHVGGLGTASVTEDVVLGHNDILDTLFFRSVLTIGPGGPIFDFLQLGCGPACDGWQLDTPIGPLVGFDLFAGTGLATDQGLLELEAFPIGASFDFEATVVPEPSTALLLAGGLALLAARRRS